MLVTIVIMFSTQRCFMRLCARYVVNVGNQVQFTTLHLALGARYVGEFCNQVQYTTLLHATLCMLGL
jgi:hypothetical protein